MSRAAWEAALHWAAVACYIASFVLYANAVLFGQSKRLRWGTWVAALGLLPHAVALLIRWIASGHGPYMAKYEVLSSNAWIAILFTVLFVARKPAWASLSLVSVPASILAIAIGFFANPEIRELPPTLRSVWLVYHIAFAKLAAAAFLLSLACGVLVLLKRRPAPPPWTSRVPEIDALDAYTVRFVGFGFIFWTVTIVAGAIWANQSWGSYWSWDAIQTWSLVSWVVYGVFLHTRLFFKLGPRATALWSVACFFLFIAALLVIPFILPSLHSSYFQ